MTGSVTFSTGIGGDGSTVTDDDNATTGLRDGGWRTRFVPCFTNQVSIANYVVTQANAASASATAAGLSATSAAAAYDSFDDRYLGAKTSDPTLDNDGNALLTGALYWNSTSSVMKVYSGSAWSAAYVPSSGYLALTGGTMTGAITFASGQTVANLASGSAGTIPYQSAPGTTAMLAVGTSGQVLTSNGAAAPTWETASGGGGTATGASYTNPTAAGTAAAAFGSGASAAANYSTSLGNNSAGSQGSVTATGAGAMALGGSYASGTDSFAAAIGNNTSTYGAQNTSAIAMGRNCKSTGLYSSVAIGINCTAGNGIAMGYQSTATGDSSICISNNGSVATSAWSGVFGGGFHTSSGQYSTVLGGGSNQATANYSTVIGGNRGNAQHIGKVVFGCAWFTGVIGHAQDGKIVIGAETTTTTAVVLTSDGNAASTNNQLIVASGQAMAISGTLIAKQSSSGNMAGWNITGIVSNNGGTMAVSGLALTAIGSDSITLGASPTIAVDNTNKGVTITSGYKSATTIHWVATVNTSEVTV